MTATIDLGTKETVLKISMNVFNDEAAWIYLPSEVEVSTSDDGINFTTLRRFSSEEIKKANELIEVNANGQSTRYIKVMAKNAGKIPDGKQGGGNDAWLFVDEITVE